MINAEWAARAARNGRLGMINAEWAARPVSRRGLAGL